MLIRFDTLTLFAFKFTFNIYLQYWFIKLFGYFFSLSFDFLNNFLLLKLIFKFKFKNLLLSL